MAYRAQWPASGGSSGGRWQPKHGKGRGKGPKGGTQPASGGVPPPLAPHDRWSASQVEPWESRHHGFHYTKAACGARIDMVQGEWWKEMLTTEVVKHPKIVSWTPLQNKLLMSSADKHKRDTKYR